MRLFVPPKEWAPGWWIMRGAVVLAFAIPTVLYLVRGS